jgi:hypothetical protein
MATNEESKVKVSSFVPNSFQTPNAYVDVFMPYLTGEEYKVLNYATRRILGFQKRQDHISLSQFTDGTKSREGETLDSGTGLSVATVKKCLANLVKYGLMIHIADNDTKTNLGAIWSLQWNGEKINWTSLEERRTIKKQKHAKKMKKARSMRQTPPNGIEDPSPNGIEDTPPNGIETQKTVETQGNPDKGGLSEKEIQQANAMVDAMLENAKKMKYENRDKIPETMLTFADAYVDLTKQKPTKRVLHDWIATFSDWMGEGLNVQDIRDAYQYATRPEGGFLVGRPGSLTNTAVALKTKALAQASQRPAVDEVRVQQTQQMLAEKLNGNFVPRPAHIERPRIGKAG